MQGPSTIHSTEVRDEAYCNVIEYGLGQRLVLDTVRTQVDSAYDPHAAVQRIAAVIVSPGLTGYCLGLMGTSVSGRISYQAKYSASPFGTATCIVPVWISVESPSWPPIPIQVEEASTFGAPE